MVLLYYLCEFYRHNAFPQPSTVTLTLPYKQVSALKHTQTEGKLWMCRPSKGLTLPHWATNLIYKHDSIHPAGSGARQSCFKHFLQVSSVHRHPDDDCGVNTMEPVTFCTEVSAMDRLMSGDPARLHPRPFTFVEQRQRRVCVSTNTTNATGETRVNLNAYFRLYCRSKNVSHPHQDESKPTRNY